MEQLKAKKCSVCLGRRGWWVKGADIDGREYCPDWEPCDGCDGTGVEQERKDQ
ncbi:hypothetical protein [Paenibacillus sp. EPM92]|uniref:hypothetical protein n=1 Tax=Paenibacillus sp. EPM92 TaxID=1561195 RepID=UPI0019159847|nr:hypothetical protein [Paenibacillus sp. EPM92]